MSDYQTILTDVSGKVATIWLNRPERRSSFSPGMTRQLYAAFARFEADDGVRAIVVTGAGRYLSAGADLGRGGGTFARPAGADGPAERLAPVPMRTPVIAALNGSAVSVAATKALVYDGLGQDRAESHAIEHQVFRWTGNQADAAEGVSAFLEKRTPRWPLSKVEDYPPML